VLAVADVFDPMTTERPYRPALTVEETMAHLIEERGVPFDATVVDAVVECADELVSIRAQAGRRPPELPGRRDRRQAAASRGRRQPV
jgi:putative two-component system response regulator